MGCVSRTDAENLIPRLHAARGMIPLPKDPVPGDMVPMSRTSPHLQRVALPVLSYALPCVELGPVALGQKPCGCGQKVRECGVHGTCTTGVLSSDHKSCVNCSDYRSVADVDTSTRHLLYYVYPVTGSNWEWNIEQLLSRIHLFNGRRVVAVSLASGNHPLDPIDKVTRLLKGHATVIGIPHAKTLGEVTAFRQLLTWVKPHVSDTDYTFYGHAKGVTHGNPVPEAIDTWTRLLYAANLDNWEQVSASLATHPCTGAFKRPASAFPWHYSGTFYWLRNKDVFARNWQNVLPVYGGTELWPGGIFTEAEAGELFYSGNGPLMYDVKESYRAELAYNTPEWGTQRDGSMELRERFIAGVTQALGAGESIPCAGTGIVMLGGGDYDISSYVSIRMLRLHSQLPIKLYHRRDKGVSPQVRRLPGVEVLELDELHPGFPTTRYWEWKEVAIRASGFQHALYLDADAYPTHDVGEGFQDPGYLDTGLCFWQDIPDSEGFYDPKVYGVAKSGVTPQGGVIYIDVARHARLLNGVRYCHEHSNWFYGHGFSDQEVMRGVLAVGAIPYCCLGPTTTTSDRKVFSQGPFIHRTGAKFPIDNVYDLPRESLAHTFLESYFDVSRLAE